ncbi:snurportin-1-like isoform X1 [Papaver somniferum]|uniref:snurportin-1-like isoform X1 n=1 Tax=Papaver somniferum TaxID=3469 RepID=UPI000E703BF2|nr:snurportin-1-like isoform X1 [Papaver somniferum]XP_026410698.1 snurportin-1-like isoform X1 [Papaver somniferum]XP_026410699.1 snurportin-1-like isoform X1 [Papaver somniferum]
MGGLSTEGRRQGFKRLAISDQQRRREIALLRQSQQRRDSQNQARSLASSVISLPTPSQHNNQQQEEQPIHEELEEPEAESSSSTRDFDVLGASKLKGAEARKWFSRQLMLPEWMIDIPPRLNHDWYVYARPSGKRCFVVSSDGTTVSRLRNGSILHHFPSVLPNGARTRDNSGSAQSYCLLDCIFHEHDQTYYVIDMICWKGYSLYDCTAEFRFFWLNSKLVETGACNTPSMYHKYKFSVVPIYDCEQMGLQTAYMGTVPYVKDGLSFYNKHAHYHTGTTPLALVWKDDNCSQYVIDTDSKGQIPPHQQVVLILNEDGSLTTSDDPPIVFGCLSQEFILKSDLKPGNFLRFTIGDGGMSFVDGKLERADLHYTNQAYHARASADSYSKILFQYTARHSPLKIEDLVASLGSSEDVAEEAKDVEMIG